MSCLGPFELNIIKRKIIDKLYLLSPRSVSYEKLLLLVDNPLREDFDICLSYLTEEGLIIQKEEEYVLSDEGSQLYNDQAQFNESFPLADVPRTNFG